MNYSIHVDAIRAARDEWKALAGEITLEAWEAANKARREFDQRTAKLCEALHDLLGSFDGRDPETDGLMDLLTTGKCVRKAQAVLAEVE